MADNTERDIEITEMVFKGMTFAEVGRQYGLSGERVSQITEKIMARLRHPARLDPYEWPYDRADGRLGLVNFIQAHSDFLLERLKHYKLDLEEAAAFEQIEQEAPTLFAAAMDRTCHPLAYLKLKVRIVKALQAMGVNDIADLVTRTVADLNEYPNLDEVQIEEIIQKLAKHDLRLGMVFKD